MFEEDPFPNKPKILFIGHPSSTHTISWIDLLKNEELNVRLFGLPTGLPPDSWKVKTYLTVPELPTGLDVDTRLWFYPRPEEKVEVRNTALSLEAMRQNLIRQENLILNASKQEAEILYDTLSKLVVESTLSYKIRKKLLNFKNTLTSRFGHKKTIYKHESDPLEENKPFENTVEKYRQFYKSHPLRLMNTSEDEPRISDLIPHQPHVAYDTRYPSIEDWLSAIVQEWQPDVIHTLGLDPAGFFFWKVRQGFHLEGIGKWVLQLRGGSDLTLSRFDPDQFIRIVDALQDSDCILTDNRMNIAYTQPMGIDPGKFSSICPVPGTGGIDVALLENKQEGRPSSRRAILWPKAYDCPWSQAMPVLEALKIAWDDIQPCEVHVLAATPEVRMWINALPEQVKSQMHVYDRIGRQDVFNLLGTSRVMLAPSLVDGVPNTLYEAMATGAFPIVSPLDTILPVVKAKENVIFARNLYPEEIAQALIMAMNDPQLVDLAAERNLELVRRIANRDVIRTKVVEFYRNIACA